MKENCGYMKNNISRPENVIRLLKDSQWDLLRSLQSSWPGYLQWKLQVCTPELLVCHKLLRHGFSADLNSSRCSQALSLAVGFIIFNYYLSCKSPDGLYFTGCKAKTSEDFFFVANLWFQLLNMIQILTTFYSTTCPCLATSLVSDISLLFSLENLDNKLWW